MHENKAFLVRASNRCPGQQPLLDEPKRKEQPYAKTHSHPFDADAVRRFIRASFRCDDDVARTQKAAQVFKEIMNTPDQGIPHDLLDKAKCIAIFQATRSLRLSSAVITAAVWRLAVRRRLECSHVYRSRRR